MNKAIRLIQNYLLYALPFILICMVWGTVVPTTDREATGFQRILWEIFSWNLMAWFAVLIIFLVMLIASSQVREKTLKRLANIKERDEREQQITGVAARSAYISTIGLLIFLLFFSLFNFNVRKYPDGTAPQGKSGLATITMHFNLTDSAKKEAQPDGTIFESKDIPLSKSAIILLVLIWQLVAFNLTARRQAHAE